LTGRPGAVVAISDIANGRYTVQGRFAMNCRCKILTAVLPVAILVGVPGAGAAEPARTALIQIPQTQSAMPQAAPPQAAPAAAAQTPYSATYEGHITVRADRTATDVFTKRFKILAPSAIALVSQQQATYVEGMESLDTVEAFTQKADGAQVPVDPANIITRDAATGLASTFTRDLKQRTVIFRDVQVGDTVVLTQRRQTRRGLFPGQFFYADVFPRNLPVASAQIIVEAPAALDLQVKAIGAALSTRVEDTGDIRRHTVTLAPRPFMLPDVRAVASVDVDPVLLISTFKSYVEMGRAYAAEALPKAKVTPEIIALAEEITKGIEDRRRQAMAIDAWMKKNIRYVAVYLSLGRVVPNDAASVLHNKFGDCKDKATLMSALLAAKGIASEQALINLGNAYTLPEPPTMVVLNHVILYLPEFDLYDDPTANFAAFGVLAAENYDKPVVRVSAAGATLARTPAMQAQDHTAHARTTITVGADGVITGRTVERNTGIFGLALRAAGSGVQNVGSDNAARIQLQTLNSPGSGRFDLGNATETSDPVVVEGSFALNQKFNTPGQGARAIIPAGMALTVRPGNFLLGTIPNNRNTAFVCYAGRQVEDIDATFDPALPMPVPPAPLAIDNASFSYRATFEIEGRTFKMHREFISRVAGQTCQPGLEAQIAGDINALRGNLNMSFVFQRAGSPAAAAATATPASPTAPTAVTTVRLTPVAATTAPALVAPAAPNTVDLKRAVASGGKLRLDFLYSINPDCTSIGFATVRIVEQPRHGRITVDNGTGFTNFPASNPRAERNKRRSDGVVVVYEPEPGYFGADSLDFDAIFASGSLSKRHYAIDVR
jgi:transglutaminase-like putative cysteine protease